jgi:circadian clock protein KaiC
VATLKKLERTFTGIPGFDEMLDGGLPRGRVILVLGEPGAGKTILGSQFLLNGIQKFDERGLFVSLEENKGHYLDEMNTFQWDMDSSMKSDQLLFIDASPIRSAPTHVQIMNLTLGQPFFSLVALLEIIKNQAAAGVRRIVVDPVSQLILQYSDRMQRRKAMLDLVEALSMTGATCLLTSELRSVGTQFESGTRQLQLEEYLVHGVILMRTTTFGKNSQRIIQVEKMRGTRIDRSPRPYNIGENGIEVYSRESVM